MFSSFAPERFFNIGDRIHLMIVSRVRFARLGSISFVSWCTCGKRHVLPFAVGTWLGGGSAQRSELPLKRAAEIERLEGRA